MDFAAAKNLFGGVIRQGSYLGLERVQALLSALGDPQLKLRCVHIAGSGGKGSVAAMTESILRSAGYKTGRYTSPAMFEFNERMAVNGVDITDGEFEKYAAPVRQAAAQLESRGLQPPTEFEFVTAMAFVYFADKKCEIVVLETGMGGRLDATNTVRDPVCAVITSIGLDHTAELGDTVAKIAGEKAGIIKPDCDVVSCVQTADAAQVIERRCREQSARLHIAQPDRAVSRTRSLYGQSFDYKQMCGLSIPLIGAHQLSNASVVLKVIEVMRQKGWNISDEAVFDGLKNTVLHGRLEVISRQPLVIYDASHNPQKVGALADTLKDLLPDRKFIFVMGVLAEKDFRGMIGLTAGLAECYVTVTPPYARTAPMDSGALKTEIEKQFCDVENGGDVRTGLQKALARQEISGSPICCFGSFYSAKPIYEFFGEGRV